MKSLTDEVDADAYLEKPLSLDHLQRLSTGFLV